MVSEFRVCLWDKSMLLPYTHIKRQMHTLCKPWHLYRKHWTSGTAYDQNYQAWETVLSHISILSWSKLCTVARILQSGLEIPFLGQVSSHRTWVHGKQKDFGDGSKCYTPPLEDYLTSLELPWLFFSSRLSKFFEIRTQRGLCLHITRR